MLFKIKAEKMCESTEMHNIHRQIAFSQVGPKLLAERFNDLSDYSGTLQIINLLCIKGWGGLMEKLKQKNGENIFPLKS